MLSSETDFRLNPANKYCFMRVEERGGVRENNCSAINCREQFLNFIRAKLNCNLIVILFITERIQKTFKFLFRFLSKLHSFLFAILNAEDWQRSLKFDSWPFAILANFYLTFCRRKISQNQFLNCPRPTFLY